MKDQSGIKDTSKNTDVEYYRRNYSGGTDNIYAATRVGEERGYVLGVEDERKKFRVKMTDIIRNLKARGYPLLHIAEDTGYSVEEVSSI